ncbi:hypothetical protein [Brevundimonas sp.]|uniref:hypothetical protein n=1 Tax=Brevundimonas sp. TaxID=1871086 RepID=UPI002D497D02|nr:hypothetical protein [Brevundimonas sp.]HYD28911.1 hypothetical protein [Brevundimonas sp.]
MSVGIGRIRHALGDGATAEQARAIHELLTRAGLLGTAQVVRPRLAGIAEIAALAGVSSPAVCQWRDLPEPLDTIKAGRVWDLADVEAYLESRR